MFEKIMVIGSPGSGKTTFSLELSEILDIPVTHLDRLFWRDNWVSVDDTEFDRQLTDEVCKNKWIIDGNYDRTINVRLENCDTVIYLDYPAIVSVFGYLCRLYSNRGTSRADMGGYCPEKFDFEFLKYIISFNIHKRRKYRDMLKDTKNKNIYIFGSRRTGRKFLESLRKKYRS